MLEGVGASVDQATSLPSLLIQFLRTPSHNCLARPANEGFVKFRNVFLPDQCATFVAYQR